MQEQKTERYVSSSVSKVPTYSVRMLRVGMSINAAVAMIGFMSLLSTAKAIAQPMTANAVDSSLSSELVATTQVIRYSSLPFQREIRMSKAVAPGEIELAQQGLPGIQASIYQVVNHNSTKRYRLLTTEVIKSPIDEITLAGIRTRSAAALPSRSGYYSRCREIDMVATGYAPMEGSGRGICASGMRAGYGVVAVDPNIIPLGTRLYIKGYGYAVAGDTGGAIKNFRIDLGSTTRRDAMEVGRRRVKVMILSTPQL